MYLNDIFTVTVNMAGLPGIAVPAGKDAQGLPLGLQLIGRPFDEETLFSLGEVIEQAAGRFTPARWFCKHTNLIKRLAVVTKLQCAKITPEFAKFYHSTKRTKHASAWPT